jgi:hypothetical protein
MYEIDEAIRVIESRIGIREGFFHDLVEEDDWSFIIKAHALLESACAELLTEKSGQPDTIDIFSRLELSARTTGKLAFLRAFDLLIDRERRFISALSELRNLLVHNARNTSFNLNHYVTTLDKNQKNNFVESFGYAYLGEAENGKEQINYPDKVLKEPKQTIWLGLKYILGVISVQIQTIRFNQESYNLYKELYSLHIQQEQLKTNQS